MVIDWKVVWNYGKYTCVAVYMQRGLPHDGKSSFNAKSSFNMQSSFNIRIN